MTAIGNSEAHLRPKSRSHAPGQAAIWSAMRAAEPGWTARQIAAEAAAPLSSVHQYLAALQRGGFVRCVEPALRHQGGADPATWRLCRRPALAPMVDHATRTARAQTGAAA